MNFIFKLYCLPGRILANLWYLWPKKGEVWASSRRRGHPFVHFCYATVIYLVALFLVGGAGIGVLRQGAGEAPGMRVVSSYSTTNQAMDQDRKNGNEDRIREEIPKIEDVRKVSREIIFKSEPVIQDISNYSLDDGQSRIDDRSENDLEQNE